MLTLIWSTSTALIASITTGYLTVPYFHTHRGRSRIALSCACGACTLIFLISVLHIKLSVSAFSIPVALFIGIAALSIPTSRKAIILDLRSIASKRGICLLSTFALLWGAAIFPILKDPSVITFDGSVNHDNVLYPVNATWALDYDILTPPETSLEYPGLSSAKDHSGLTPGWGRMGGEELLAFISELSGSSPYESYTGTFAFLLVASLLVALLLSKLIWKQTNNSLAAHIVTLIGAYPFYFFFYANGNFANLAGLFTISLLLLLLAQGIDEEVPTAARLWQIAICHSACLAAYPEMLPVLYLGATAILAPQAAQNLRITFSRRWTLPAAALIIGAALNPVTLIRAYNGILHSIRFSGTPWASPQIFEGTTSESIIPAAFSMAPEAGKDSTGALYIVCSLVILYCVGTSLKRGRFPLLTIGTTAFCAFLWAYSDFKDFGYGKQKALQYAGVFCVLAGSTGLAGMLDRLFKKNSLTRLSILALPITVFSFWIQKSYRSIFEEFNFWAAEKKIDNSWKELATWYDKLDEQHPLLVVDGSMSFGYIYKDSWLSLVFKDRPIQFAQIGSVTPIPLERQGQTKRPQVTEKNYAVFSNSENVIQIDAPVVYQNKEFKVLRSDLSELRIQGISNLEFDTAWTYSHFTIECNYNTDRFLRVELARRFPDWPLDEAIIINQNGRESRNLLNENGQVSIQLSLPSGPNKLSFTPSSVRNNKYEASKFQRAYLLESLKIVDRLPMPGFQDPIPGLHGLEGGFRWMGPSFTITLPPGPETHLNLKTERGYEKIPHSNHLLVELPGEITAQFPVNRDGQGACSFWIPASESTREVIVTSPQGAARPSDHSDSPDTRELSFAISHLDFTPTPAFETRQPHASPK